MHLISILTLTACTGGSAPSEGPRERPSEPLSAADAHLGLNARDPDACTSCHEAHVDEWRQSMHSRSHPDDDPIYAAMRKLRMAKQGEAIGAKCQTCHNPLAPDAPDSPEGRVGVGCGACHVLEPGAPSPPADGRTVCLTCHEATKNPAGVATCTTGPENASMGEVACASCHLKPAEDGHHSHTFDGPHRAWLQDDPSMLASGLNVTLQRDGDAVVVSVTNTAGHGYPTGFPGRVAQIVVRGKDGDTDWTRSPEELMLTKRYADADGKPTLPPFATQLVSDTRLDPGETRTARVEVPAGASELEAAVVFRLVPPPAAKVLGLTGALSEAREAKLATLD